MFSSTDDYLDDWINDYCTLAGKEFVLQIDKNWICDEFNTSDLAKVVKHFDLALAIIVDDSDELEDIRSRACQNRAAKQTLREAEYIAETLYGLIHQRYIHTQKGMFQIRNGYLKKHFGRCPKAFCGEPMLPTGLSDNAGHGNVKLYCPRCNDIFIYATTDKNSEYVPRLDGSYYGESFPHAFFMNFPELRPTEPPKPFVPTLYGFKIHPSAYNMQIAASRFEQLVKVRKSRVHSVDHHLRPGWNESTPDGSSSSSLECAFNPLNHGHHRKRTAEKASDPGEWVVPSKRRSTEGSVQGPEGRDMRQSLESKSAGREPQEKKSAENGSAERWAGGKKPAEKLTTEKHVDVKKSAEKKTSEMKSVDKKSSEKSLEKKICLKKKSHEKKTSVKNPVESVPSETKAVRKRLSEKKSVERGASDKKSVQKRPSEKKSVERETSEKKSAERKPSGQNSANICEEDSRVLKPPKRRTSERLAIKYGRTND